MRLTRFEQDALRELANIGAGNASATLSPMLADKISIRVSSLHYDTMSRIEGFIQGPRELIIVLYTPITGKQEGCLLMLLPIKSASALASIPRNSDSKGKNSKNAPALKNHDKIQPLSQSQIKILQKAGALIADQYLNALKNFTGLELKPGGTNVTATFGESIKDFMTIHTKNSTRSLYIATQFKARTKKLEGGFMLLLNLPSAQELVDSIKKKLE